MQFEEIREKLLGLEVALLCDADKQLRVMDPSIRPLRTGLKLIGKAFTLICLHDHLTIMKALQDALPGDVLVIDTRNSNRAVAGELFAVLERLHLADQLRAWRAHVDHHIEQHADHAAQGALILRH